MRTQDTNSVSKIDVFFTKTHCDRCKKPFPHNARTLSWFNEEAICLDCSSKETDLKAEMSTIGVNPDKYEGCGYVPRIKDIKAREGIRA